MSKSSKSILDMYEDALDSAYAVAAAVCDDGVPVDVAIWAACVRMPSLATFPDFASFVADAIQSHKDAAADYNRTAAAQ